MKKKVLFPILAVVLALSLALPMAAVGAVPVNLITNGDFEAGNTGFTTEYTYLDPSNTGPWTLGPEYMYTVSTDPNLYHSAWSSFGDHTSGSGNMMIVNGTWEDTSPGYNAVVWAQEVTLPECVSTHPLYAGQTMLVGDVHVKSDGEQVCVKFVLNADAITAGWLITEAHVAVADIPDDIPQTKKHNPIPGQFPVNVTIDPGVTETDWYCLDVSGWTAPFAVAAHAVVEIAEISHVEDTSFCIVSDASTLYKAYGSSDPLAAAVPAWVHPSWASQYGTTTPFGATWIWNSYRTLQPVLGEVVEFKRSFVVDGTPTAATLQITADNGYEAYMNETSIGSAQVHDVSLQEWEASNLTEAFVNSSGWQPPAETYPGIAVNPGSNTLIIVGANEYMGTLDGQTDGTVDSNPGAIAYKLCVTASKTVIDRPYDEETAWGGTEHFPGKNWATYIDYTPVCQYLLEFWAGNSYPGSVAYPAQPAILEVQINGTVVGTLALAYTPPTAPTPGWLEFSYTWDAGSATSANIEIRDTRHIMYGDDFVLDDISFVQQ